MQEILRWIGWILRVDAGNPLVMVKEMVVVMVMVMVMIMIMVILEQAAEKYFAICRYGFSSNTQDLCGKNTANTDSVDEANDSLL